MVAAEVYESLAEDDMLVQVKRDREFGPALKKPGATDLQVQAVTFNCAASPPTADVADALLEDSPGTVPDVCFVGLQEYRYSIIFPNLCVRVV